MPYKASVKVMRSYDYCHFEASLGSEEELSLQEIDDMRKMAASLVDRAVDDYRLMKAQESDRGMAKYNREEMKRRLAAIREKPEGERTLNEVALLKSAEDAAFWNQYNDADGYDYFSRDDERDHHFARLATRERVRVA